MGWHGSEALTVDGSILSSSRRSRRTQFQFVIIGQSHATLRRRRADVLRRRQHCTSGRTAVTAGPSAIVRTIATAWTVVSSDSAELTTCSSDSQGTNALRDSTHTMETPARSRERCPLTLASALTTAAVAVPRHCQQAIHFSSTLLTAPEIDSVSFALCPSVLASSCPC